MKLSPKERQRLMARAKYLLLVEGQSQIQVAAALRLSRQTLLNWAKAGGWNKEVIALRDPVNAAALGLEDSLNAFLAYTRLRYPDAYEQLKPIYNKFTKTY